MAILAAGPSRRGDSGGHFCQPSPAGSAEGREIDEEGEVSAPKGAAALSEESCGQASTAIPADTTTITMHALPLGDHWHGTLRYGVNDGVVYLDGTASKSTGPYSCMTSLPKAARPANAQLDITVNLGDAIGTIQVLHTGQVCPFLPPPGGAEFGFASLAGISFPASA
jgi:hypothetical protein